MFITVVMLSAHSDSSLLKCACREQKTNHRRWKRCKKQLWRCFKWPSCMAGSPTRGSDSAA